MDVHSDIFPLPDMQLLVSRRGFESCMYVGISMQEHVEKVEWVFREDEHLLGWRMLLDLRYSIMRMEVRKKRYETYFADYVVKLRGS